MAHEVKNPLASIEVMAGLPHRDTVEYSVLTPNLKGFEAALAAGARAYLTLPPEPRELLAVIDDLL